MTHLEQKKECNCPCHSSGGAECHCSCHSSSANYVRVGEMYECGHCQPTKYSAVEPCPCKCHSSKEENLVVTHGGVTHGIKEAEKCPTCQRVVEEFEIAKKDGTLDKLLQDTQPERMATDLKRMFPKQDTQPEWEEIAKEVARQIWGHKEHSGDGYFTITKSDAEKRVVSLIFSLLAKRDEEEERTFKIAKKLGAKDERTRIIELVRKKELNFIESEYDNGWDSALTSLISTLEDNDKII